MRETAWIDYLLTGVLGCLALFTIGQGVAQPSVGLICGAIYCVGTGVSFTVGMRVRGTRFAAFDGLVYGFAAIAAVFGQSFLNQLLPADSFPFELRSAGMVTWLLCLGSFAAWRDATRLFQAVPALALFGLVGVYDTYELAPFLFFGYLLCLALMFGRAHARSMLVQATQSGFSRIEEGISLSEGGADRDSVLRAMRRGPWRWMAGPEWAVASAGAVILVSLFGAPIIHEGVRGMASKIHLSVPGRMMAAAYTGSALTTESLKRIGTGPRNLTNTLEGVATLDKARYLRTQVFTTYGVAGWIGNLAEFVPEAKPDVRAAQLRAISNPKRFDFRVEMTIPSSSPPVPIEVETISDPPGATILSDGTVRVIGSVVGGTAVESSLPLDQSLPLADQASRRPGPEYIVPGRLQQLANEITAGAKTDLEKANRLVAAIAARANYNLKAARVPDGVDPVEYFLFTSHEGYCDLFASAMVELARDAGLDARYVIGYLPDDSERDDYGRYKLLQSDAHAWAEIYFNGLGWVVFDATARAKDVTPKADGVGGSISAAWIPVAASLAGLAALVYYGPRFKLRRHLTPSALYQRQLDRLYLLFAAELGRRAHMRKPAAATPDAWLTMTRDALGNALPAATHLNTAFVEALYAREPVTDSRLGELRSLLRDLRRVKS
ncbi:MAG: transglutaminase-like domain-containing protein [Fimbriimonadaceae bacterium]